MHKKHENTIPNSHIRAVISFFGEDCGLLGPRLLIEHEDFSTEDLALEHLADFLNDATGVGGSARSISKDMENGILEIFSKYLTLLNGRYCYTGPQSSIFLNAYRPVKHQPKDKAPINGERVISMGEGDCLIGEGVIKTHSLVGCIAIGGFFELDNGEVASILTHITSLSSDQNVALFKQLYSDLEEKFKIKEGRIFIFHNDFSEMNKTQLFSFENTKMIFIDLIKNLELVLSELNHNILTVPYTTIKGKQIYYDSVNDDITEMIALAKKEMYKDEKDEKDEKVASHATINTSTKTYQTNLLHGDCRTELQKSKQKI